MPEIDILSNEYFLIAVSGTAGIVLSWITQRILNKRGIFSYYVSHNTVGASSEDPIFGNVRVTWNDNPIANLYFSTIEVKNESLNDYENVCISVFTDDTILLSEFTSIVDTPYILEWSDEYREKLHVPPGQNPNQNQIDIYNYQREYVIPVFNRGQVVRLNYLNASCTKVGPHIWMSANMKGVVVKFKVPTQLFIGVPVQHAGIAGLISGFVAITVIVSYVTTPWVIALLALVYGLIAQLPGALLVRGLRIVKENIGN